MSSISQLLESIINDKPLIFVDYSALIFVGYADRILNGILIGSIYKSIS